MGLSVAREIVAAHGGRIWVNSEPGKGAEFCFTLPIKERSSGAFAGLTAEPSVAAPLKTSLEKSSRGNVRSGD
jgi:hypothetical protein